MAFVRRVQNFLSRECPLVHGDTILLAVSGGPDSVALLDFYATLQRKYSLCLAVAHVNYRLRKADSDQDEHLVRTLAHSYNIPLFVKRPIVPKKNRDEAMLRDIRYAFFRDIARKHRFRLIALAHHQNDQAETFLLRLLRGSGLRGLGCMKVLDGSLIRPFLGTTRADIEAYLATRSLPFRQDMSNMSHQYLRNRIRHDLLPYLKDRFEPRIIERLTTTADILARDATLLEELLYPLPSLQKTPDTISFHRSELLGRSRAEIYSHLRSWIEDLLPGTYPPTQGKLRECLKLIESNRKLAQKCPVDGLMIRRNRDRVSLVCASH